MAPPTEHQVVCLRQIVLAGLGDHLARRVQAEDILDLKWKNGYKASCSEGPRRDSKFSFVRSPSSLLAHRRLSWTSRCSSTPPPRCSKRCRSLSSTRRSWRPPRCTWKVNVAHVVGGCHSPFSVLIHRAVSVKVPTHWQENTVKRIMGTPSGFFKFILLASCLTGVSAVDAEWIPQLLPQYCHFSSPLESPSPWWCSSTGTIRCHRSSTFCKFPADERHALESASAYICVSWLCLSCSPCGLATAASGDGISRGPGTLQAVFQVSAWGTGTKFSLLPGVLKLK